MTVACAAKTVGVAVTQPLQGNQYLNGFLARASYYYKLTHAHSLTLTRSLTHAHIKIVG